MFNILTFLLLVLYKNYWLFEERGFIDLSFDRMYWNSGGNSFVSSPAFLPWWNSFSCHNLPAFSGTSNSKHSVIFYRSILRLLHLECKFFERIDFPDHGKNSCWAQLMDWQIVVFHWIGKFLSSKLRSIPYFARKASCRLQWIPRCFCRIEV